MPIRRSSSGLKGIVVLLLIGAFAFLCFDVWELATGEINPNKHLPFLTPVGFMAIAGLIWYGRGYIEPPTPDEDTEDEDEEEIEEVELDENTIRLIHELDSYDDPVTSRIIHKALDQARERERLRARRQA